MASIIPIPTTRVGDLFVRQRLIGQVQTDQLDLFRLQNQISTGQRLQLPSGDAPAALRAINLQRLLDRKGQIETNVKANNGFLGAADTNLRAISGTLIDLRAGIIGNAGTLSNESQRLELVNEIDEAIRGLMATGNAKFQGRYLFAGSRAQDQPYDFTSDFPDQFVQYFGNEGVLRSFVDLERLFDTNLAGTDVFGGISSQVKGIDLTPHVSADTLLSTINGGEGIGRNAAITISINTGSATVSSVVDLSGAVTLGDVTRLIELGAPAGTEILAGQNGAGLTLTTSSGTITVSEVAQSRTASELGIRTPTGAAVTSSITGTPLNAAVLKTTQLDALLGTKAHGRLESVNANNDIVLTASQNGVAFNDADVVFVNDGVAGSETATYNSGAGTLTVHIQAGFSTAAQVAAAINSEGTFSAAVDYHDATSAGQAGSNSVVAATFTNATEGGSGQALDADGGLIITNGGKTVTLDTSTATTVEDLLNLINGAGLGLAAEINATRSGINVRSRLSGADLTIGENGGTLATQLGIRTYTTESKLADFNRGVGVPTTETLEQLDTAKLDSLRIVARDGTVLTTNLAGSNTLEDVAAAINAAPGNNVGTTAVLARLSANGNRIELVDSSTATTGALTVQSIPGTQAAEYLGFLATGETQRSTTTVEGDVGNFVMSGGDVLGNDVMIQARDGRKLWIDLAGADTVGDVIQRINSNPDNNTGTTHVVARLAATGNGIELVDQSTATTGDLVVRAAEGSQAAQYLGFVPEGETQVATNTLDSSGNFVIQSADHHTVESDSVFNTLIRLKQALEAGDTEEIGRSIDRLDADISRVTFARSEIGSRLQSLEVIGTKLQDENVQLKHALSNEVEVDLVEAISNMTSRQFALQASLQTAANLLQLSLLDFI
jgi:flagellin-like hook-associated protein FlgL